MIAERNPKLERLNLGFLIAGGAIILATAALIAWVGATAARAHRWPGGSS